MEEDIKKLAKRINMLCRELEVTSLDIALYAKPLSQGKFPNKDILLTGNNLSSFCTELYRIEKAWNELFKEQLEKPEEEKRKKK